MLVVEKKKIYKNRGYAIVRLGKKGERPTFPT